MVNLPDFRYYTAWHSHVNRLQYRSPADPWTQIHVDPTDPERFAVVSLLWGLGRVRGSDWDRPENCRRLTDNRMYEGLCQRFTEGRDWTETAYHDWVTESIEEENDFRGFEDVETVAEDHYSAVDALYERIAEDGYRPNHGTVYDSPKGIDTIHDLDPMVLIGRSGSVIWTEGFHRLYLARFAGVDEIPVYVLRRHEAWQQVRDRIADGPTDEMPAALAEYANHPDLQNVPGDTE